MELQRAVDETARANTGSSINCLATSQACLSKNFALHKHRTLHHRGSTQTASCFLSRKLGMVILANKRAYRMRYTDSYTVTSLVWLVVIVTHLFLASN